MRSLQPPRRSTGQLRTSYWMSSGPSAGPPPTEEPRKKLDHHPEHRRAAPSSHASPYRSFRVSTRSGKPFATSSRPLVIKDGRPLDDVERLQYLKTSVSGPAGKILDQFAVTDSNFATAWATLSRRYDNKRALVSVPPPYVDIAAADDVKFRRGNSRACATRATDPSHSSRI